VRGVHHLSVRDGHTIICEDCTSIDVSPSAVGSSIQVQVNLDGSPKSSAVSSSFALPFTRPGLPLGCDSGRTFARKISGWDASPYGWLRPQVFCLEREQ
jgi:hypothetical protein